MPTYVVKQQVSYARSDKVTVKIDRIVGRDLRHAAELLPIGDAMRRDIERTGRTSNVDQFGRKLVIEVIAEETA